MCNDCLGHYWALFHYAPFVKTPNNVLLLTGLTRDRKRPGMEALLTKPLQMV
ncbi:hypothetical protein HanIR_Chr13g0666461 [Helianthus annuus]|nr:hypothetical protein HanIR_Chr13g0666461 [Helianthus annuus]